ncbi:hypothetical protein R3P38DRAFT_2775565 [Favolaschia claudopus]|uniref:Uncharacterized protein n=1 Tax=Favolaschia claudopus TaxID=2862362 RepID=A0AAW0BY57_9AGAR
MPGLHSAGAGVGYFNPSRGLKTAENRGNLAQREWDWWNDMDSSSFIRISTLDPLKLTPADEVLPRFTNSAPLHVFFDKIYPDVYLYYRHPGGRFPWWKVEGKTKGFLYYHCPPGYSPFSSSIRMRLVDGLPTPTAFRRGRDLSFENGLPWQLMASQIAVYDIYEGVRKKLVADGLWTAEDHKYVFEAWKNRRILFPDRTLFSLDQEFPLTLNSYLNLTMAGKGEHRNFRHRLLSTLDKEVNWAFSGLIRSGETIARFERSPLPKHASSPAVCIRILRALSPIERLIETYPGPLPTVGELLQTTNRSGHACAWTFSLTNSPNSKALELLMY